MLSYGGIPLQAPSAEEAGWISAQIPIESAFGFFRPKSLGDPDLNPRPLFNWFLNRPARINCLTHPWGASRFGYVLVLADDDMMDAIAKQNSAGNALRFTIDDNLGSVLNTDLFQLPAVPLSKINVTPQLPLWLVPLVDLRYRFWERTAAITITEGTTTWAQLYAQIGAALGVTIAVDPIPAAYLKPGAGLARSYQPLPLLADWVASCVGQRIVRRLDGSFVALNASTARSLQIAQANANRKYAGGSLSLGEVSA